MVDLDRNGRTVLVQVLHELIIARHKAVMVDPDLTRAVRSNRVLYICIFQNDKACAALCTLGIIIHVTAAHLTARLTVIGAHRGHRDAVFDGRTLNGNRFKNFGIFTLHDLSPYTTSFVT